MLSPKRQGRAGGTIEDWGIAFEGLPLDARMYPAVGLYQRDDRVTLLSVDSDVHGKGGSMEYIGGKFFYPPVDRNMATPVKDKVDQSRFRNNLISWDGTEYSAGILKRTMEMVHNRPDDFSILLPSVLASLCLLPGSVPLLSQRSAITLLPHIGRSLQAVRSQKGSNPSHMERSLVEGDWIIRATSGDGDLEEYVVKFVNVADGDQCIGFEGSGVGTTGKSKNGLVTIFGSVNGFSISFLEEWSDEGNKGSSSRDDSSSCVVHGTLSLDGTRLEGRYRNMEFGTTGKVAGIKKADSVTQGTFESISNSAGNAELLLCLAHSHLAAVVSDDAAKDGLSFLSRKVSTLSDEGGLGPQKARLANLLKKPFLAASSLRGSGEWLASHAKELVDLYASPNSSKVLCGIENGHILKTVSELVVGSSGGVVCDQKKLEALVDQVDVLAMTAIGKRGSLSAINPQSYDEARKGVIRALVFHCNLTERLVSVIYEHCEPALDQSLLLVWQKALLIMEDGIRQAMGELGMNIRDSFRHRCNLIKATTEFLLELEIDRQQSFDNRTVDDVKSCYESIKDEKCIMFIKQKMQHVSALSAYQLVALEGTREVLSHSLSSVGVESVGLGLCRLMAQLPGGLTSSRRLGARDGRRRLPGGLGADLSVKRLMLKSILDLFLLFLDHCGHAVRQRDRGVGRTSSDSFVLAALCVSMLCLDGTGVHTVVTFLSKMRDVLSFYRSSLHVIDHGRSRDETVKVVKALSERDVAYAVLRCATAAIHVCFYQLSYDPSEMDGSFSIEYPVNWFRLELARSFTYLEDLFGKLASNRVETCSVEEWERWLYREEDRNSEKKTSNRVKALKNGRDSLIEVGTIQHLDFNSGPKSSATFRNEGKKYSGGPEHRHLSHWLHILCAAIRKGSPFRDSLLNDTALTSVLLRALGLDHVRSTETGVIGQVEIRRRDKGLLPARYRARIAFFLGRVIPAMDPNDDIVGGLFCLAGSDLLASGSEYEEYLVSREAVSLLRKLYNPDCAMWRQCVVSMVSSIMASQSLVKRLGLHAFLSGIITNVTRLSFVLLKPVVAAPFSQDGGKVSSGTSHTMVPVGADAIVSGLLRSSAEGGIVSNIDEKNGICEVILVNRFDEQDGEEDVVVGGQWNSKRAGLTVRALRTPVADVILAQEVALYLDGETISPSLLCTMLEETLNSLLSATAPNSSGLSANDLWAEEPPLSNKTITRTSAPFVLDETDIPAQTLDEKQLTAGSNEPAKSSSGTRVSTVPPSQPNETSNSPSSEAEEKCLPVDLKSTIATKQESPLDGIGSGVHGLFLDVMTIRSAVVILSNGDMISRVMEDRRCGAIFFKILCLAWPEEHELSKSKDTVLGARLSDLSFLPLYETKMCFHMIMLRSVAYREQVLSKTPEDVWNRRVTEYKRLVQERSEADSPAPTPRPNEVSSSSGANPGGQANRTVSQSTGGSQSEDDEDEQDEASALAAQHLREAAIAQMGELGIPRSYAELALRRIGGTNIEAAVHFCLENGSEIERLLAEEMQRQAAGQGGRARVREDSHLLQQLMEMGFPRRWCTEALAATGNNVDEALTWILNNNETLENLDASEEEEEDDEDASAEGGGDEEDEESDEDDTEDGDGNQESKDTNEEMVGPATTLDQEPGWLAPVTPLKVVSGRATIESSTLEVSGQSSGGFASVGVKGVLLKRGKWYYEVILGTAGCIQLGTFAK